MIEVWKDVLGYEGKYMVSNLGRVKSIIRKSVKKDTIFTPWTNRYGYKMVSLRRGEEKTGKSIHSLVWEAFNGPVPQGMQVNHINENKSDNRLENLNLMTPQENCNWGTRNKRIQRYNDRRKPVTQILPDGTEYFTYFSATAAELDLNIKNAHCYISECCRGKRDEAYGYRWSFTKKLTYPQTNP